MSPISSAPRPRAVVHRAGHRHRRAVGGCQRAVERLTHHAGAVRHEVVAGGVRAAGVETSRRGGEGVDLGDDLRRRLDEPTEREFGYVEPPRRPLDRVEVAVRIVGEEVARAERAEVRAVDVELVGVARSRCRRGWCRRGVPSARCRRHRRSRRWRATDARRFRAMRRCEFRRRVG